jgi:GNAT superfamily N-acetyltransferase
MQDPASNAPVVRAAKSFEIERIREIERISATRFVGTDRAALVDDEPADAETLADRIASNGLWVAAEGAGPVAFVMFRQVEGCAYVEQIDVLPSHAGRRLGAMLLDVVAELAREQGLAALTLSTFKDVPFNAPYYRRLGFVDLPDGALSPGLLAIRDEHIARGLDESARVFMRRDV